MEGVRESKKAPRQHYAALTSTGTRSALASDERGDDYGAVDNLTVARSKPGRTCHFSLCDHLCLPVVMFAAVVAILGAPTVFHFRPVVSFNDSATDGNNCSYESLSWGTNTSADVCTAVPYNGSVCREQLSAWQQCLLRKASPIWIDDNVMLSETENNLSLLANVIRKWATPTCRPVALSFLCQYSLPLCVTSQNGSNTLLPTKERCMNIKNHQCVFEWTYLESNTEYRKLLPDCNILPGNSSLQSDNITCADNFVIDNNNSTCRPQCGKFTQFSENLTMFSLTATVIAAVCGLLSSIAVVISIAVSNNTKYRSCFPSMYLVYASISHSLEALVIIISSINGKLYCTSDMDLMQSMSKPTLFCTISGAVLHYVVVSIILWTLLHTCFIGYKVLCPMQSKRREGIWKYIHIAISIAGWLCPLPAVLVACFDDDSKYLLSYLTPPVCLTMSKDLWYYSTMLVIQFLVAAEACLLIVIFRVLHKYQGILKSHPGGQFRISTTEKKLLLSFCYYIVVGVFILVYAAGISTNNWHKLTVAFREYFNCQSRGINLMETYNCHKLLMEIQAYSFPGLTITTSFMLGVAPVINLILVLNWKRLKQKLSSALLLICKIVPSTADSDQLEDFVT